MARRPISRAKRIRKGLEVQLTRMAMATIPHLPRPVLLALTRGLGRAAYVLARESRRVGMENLDLVYGDTRTPAEKADILRQSFCTFALILGDIFWFTRSPRERLQRYVQFDDDALASLEAAPLICITGHLGNWETLGQAVASAGFPLHSVAAPLSNPEVDKLFIPSRQLTGQIILSSEGALRRLLSVLRGGGRFAMLLDQNTKPSEGGVFVPFLGLPAPVSTGAAMLATRTGCDLVFGYALPQPDATYRVSASHVIHADEVKAMPERGSDQIDALTQRIAGHIGESILAHPTSWLWMYKRWKHVPPGVDRQAYPRYAKPLRESEASKARVLTG